MGLKPILPMSPASAELRGALQACRGSTLSDRGHASCSGLVGLSLTMSTDILMTLYPGKNKTHKPPERLPKMTGSLCGLGSW